MRTTRRLVDVNDRESETRQTDRQAEGRKRRKAEQTFGVAYFGEIAKVPRSLSLLLSSAARSFLHPTLLSTPHPRPKLQWLTPEEILSEAGWKLEQGHSVSVESALHTVKPLETGKIVTVSGIILSDGFII